MSFSPITGVTFGILLGLAGLFVSGQASVAILLILVGTVIGGLDTPLFGSVLGAFTGLMLGLKGADFNSELMIFIRDLADRIDYSWTVQGILLGAIGGGFFIQVGENTYDAIYRLIGYQAYEPMHRSVVDTILGAAFGVAAGEVGKYLFCDQLVKIFGSPGKIVYYSAVIGAVAGWLGIKLNCALGETIVSMIFMGIGGAVFGTVSWGICEVVDAGLGKALFTMLMESVGGLVFGAMVGALGVRTGEWISRVRSRIF